MQVSIFLSLLFSCSYTFIQNGNCARKFATGRWFETNHLLYFTFPSGKDFEKRVIKEVASNGLVLNQIKTK